MFNGRAAQLAGSPHLSQLEILGLNDTNLYNEDLEAILRSTAYPRLRELDISNQRSGQDYNFEGFKVLAESVFAPTLEVLLMNRADIAQRISNLVYHAKLDLGRWKDRLYRFWKAFETIDRRNQNILSARPKLYRLPWKYSGHFP